MYDWEQSLTKWISDHKSWIPSISAIVITALLLSTYYFMRGSWWFSIVIVALILGLVGIAIILLNERRMARPCREEE